MRIALVSQEYPPETGHGGIGRQTELKARGLAARGHDVVVVSASTTGPRTERVTDNGVRVIRVVAEPNPRSATEVGAWMLHSAAVAVELARLDATAPMDLVDAPEWAAEAYVHLVNRPPWRRVPTVIQLHGSLAMLSETIGWPEPGSDFDRAGREVEGACLRLAEAVYSSSSNSARWAARAYGRDASAIPVLHAGVDIELFRPRPDSPAHARPLTVLFVGRLAESKGIGVLVDAAIRLADRVPGLRLRVVGRDPDHLGPGLVRRAATAGHPSLIDLAGPLYGEELAIAMAAADLFAAPSRYEGGPGFTFLEAMACGVPVVGPSGSGVSEVVADGETGLLVAPDDVDGVEAALALLLSDAGLRARMGRLARDRVRATADTRDCMARIEAFYESVIARAFEPAAAAT